jgi:L-rhamnose mutarotase
MERVCFQLQVKPERMEHTDVNARWQAEMAEFFQGLDGHRPDEKLLRLDEIFHLE